MTAAYWMLVAGMGLVSALSPVPHQMSEDELRGALNAVTRKQRSLNANAQAHYGDLRKLQRQQVGPAEELDEIDDGLAFIPSEGAGQLETIGDGYQHLNNKQFGRALMEYLQYNADQEAPSQSIFRERERSGSRKRNGYIYLDPSRLRANALSKLFLEENENEHPEDEAQLADEEYQRTLEIIADKLKNLGDNNVFVNGDDRLLLSELLNEEEQDPRYAHIPMAERRNVNARYPLFNREYKTYRDVSKRFPVAKRSAKASANKKQQGTDPKVAQDLGGLFGTQATNSLNHTHDHEHEHEHEHEHAHEHEHEHDHKQEHTRDLHSGHTHEPVKSKALKENMLKVNKTKERAIDVRKKSVDWSQYFGIDRRKKKAIYTGRPGSQEQDDEYLLQKYYEIMAEHLNNPELVDKEGGEKRGKLQQMDAKLRNMKNLMIEEAVQMGSKNSMDSQETKDEIMSRLAAAYSMEMLRRALSELNSGTKEDQQAKGQGQNNLTDEHPPATAKNNDKRNRHSLDDFQDIEEEMVCPQMDIIERRCRATEALIGDFNQVLHIPCVLYHVCNYCEQEECLERFALEAERVCQEELEEAEWSRKHCVQAAMLLPRYPPSISQNALCVAEADSCFTRIQGRNRHTHHQLPTYRLLHSQVNDGMFSSESEKEKRSKR